MNRWITITLLIIAAIACYSIGGILGLGVLIALGLVFELLFWRGLINKLRLIKKPEETK